MQQQPGTDPGGGDENPFQPAATRRRHSGERCVLAEKDVVLLELTL